MCGKKATPNNKPTILSLLGMATAVAVTGLATGPVSAQEIGVLEEIVVTAQKREEALQDVPISVATLSGDRLNVLFSGSEDILALSGRVPGLYANSSNGRVAPRFYLRGLGNIDFDLAASQPVSIVMDDVVMENVALKSFPLFDMQQVEVIRGPQGTLFGRNTTAGIIKFNTRRPDDEFSGYVKGSYATHATTNFEGAVGGSLIDNKLATRVSVLKRDRDDWITNAHTGQESLGDYSEAAGRIQLLWTPNDSFSALLLHQMRNLDATASIFRANVFTSGSNSLNQNYDREVVYYDEGDDNPAKYDSKGTTLNLQWDFDSASATSITSWQEVTGFGRGDIDGGVVNIFGTPTPPTGITFADTFVLCPFPCLPARTWPGEILTPSLTQDGTDTEQFTQEFRLASDTDGPFNWQIGAFYFDSTFTVITEAFSSFVDGVPQRDTIVTQDNKTWAVFGQGAFDVTDRLTLTAGVRYTDDEKDFRVDQFSALWLDLGIPTFIAGPINVSDDRVSWEVSANFAMTDESSLYTRYADGFRAQTIQGRDVAFLSTPSVAVPETINSLEAGYKADLMDNRFRLNAAVYWYEIDDMQFSIIGGAMNTNQVVNANKGEAKGFEIEAEFLLTDHFLVAAGASFTDSEINDPTLATIPCGSGLCTPTDPVDPSDPTRRLVNGNPFPTAPESTYNLTLRYGAPVGNNGEIYVLTDWAFYGKSNINLYEATEFQIDNQFEGGLRIGYINFDSGWEFAAFGRNITDEDNVLGAIDFSNLTGFVNEPTVWGIEVAYEFGD